MCPKLQALKLLQIKIDHDGLKYLTKNFKELQHFSVGYVDSEQEDLLGQVFSKNKQLRSFRIDFSELTGECLSFLPNTIEKITIVQTELEEIQYLCQVSENSAQ